MAISLNQHRENITKRVIGTFSDASTNKMGLAAWFPSEPTSSKSVSIEVRRSRKLMAVDVERGTAGNLNTFGKSTEKLYIPPFFKEYFNFSDLDVYDRSFGQNLSPTPSDYASMIRTANERLMELKAKIERAAELQRSQALQTGIVTMKNGDNIDYKRQADSIVDLGSGNYWGATGVKILDSVSEGIKFIRQEGKSASRMFDLILGAEAIGALLADEALKKDLDNLNYNVGAIGTTQFNDTTGLNYHGRLSTKNGTVDLWTYDEFYENPDGSYSEYIGNKNVVLLPRDFIGKQAFAGVPAIMRDNSNAEFNEWITTVASDYYVNNFVDQRVAAHIFQIYSAPLAIPFSVDRVWTAQVLA